MENVAFLPSPILRLCQQRSRAPSIRWVSSAIPPPSLNSLSLPPHWSALLSSPTILTAIKQATHLFEATSTPEPSLSARYLAQAAFVNTPNPHHPYPPSPSPPPHELALFVDLCHQRQYLRTPVQYLVGHWDFHHITLKLKPPVLIPRPETEQLVQFVLDDPSLPSTANILDVGVGSGAILLALLHARPEWTGVGLDPSPTACVLAKENAKILGLERRCRIVQGTMTEVDLGKQFNALVSNPPYIPRREMAALQIEVRGHEDDSALCGGEDGMDVVREVLCEAVNVVTIGGSVWMEVDESHPQRMKRETWKGLKFVQHIHDFCGRPRFVQLRVAEGS
eukprot:GFKZ01015781.1.p1 GENE.GFKZ01015781.1~~GFKZ01015781.1.p1  ORF type:complete len:337 (-),score=39.37 GFKZ01015781.1:2233-3243(-)